MSTSLLFAIALSSKTGTSLWFNGTGVDDLDRVKIAVDDPQNSLPGPPVDLGDTDFTVELWVKGSPWENSSTQVQTGTHEDWILGSIAVDRDRFNEGRKMGISFAQGRVCFGVTNGSLSKFTLVSQRLGLTGSWRHIAVQRRLGGRMEIWIDGRLDAFAEGPAGDVSYPDDAQPGEPGGGYCEGPNGSWGGVCVNDPYWILGAEKHDAGPTYPSYRGLMDEIRFSRSIRYKSRFQPAGPFAPDPWTAGLYHADEGSGKILLDSSGNGSHGQHSLGDWPRYRRDTPFGGIGQDRRPKIR